MAEMQSSEGGNKKHSGKVKGKKMSTRVDLTPMVDLGFLLITFFMLTTTLNKPSAMELNVPVKEKIDDPNPPVIKETKVVTLLLDKNDKIYWYIGLSEAKLDSTDYSPEGVRKLLIEQRDRVANAPEYAQDSSREVIVLLKPSNKSRYKNMVDILDEIHIANVQRYALLGISKAEEDYIKNPNAKLNDLMLKYAK